MARYAQAVLDRSRELLASVGGGVGEALRAIEESSAGQPGPAIKVAPFEPGSVTTGAGVMKLATALFAAARARANATKQATKDASALEYQQALTQRALREPTTPAREPFTFPAPGAPLQPGAAGPPNPPGERTVMLTPDEVATQNRLYNPNLVPEKPMTAGQKANVEMRAETIALSKQRLGLERKRVAHLLASGTSGGELKFPTMDRSALTHAGQDEARARSDYLVRYNAPGGGFEQGQPPDFESDPGIQAAHNNHLDAIRNVYVANMATIGATDPVLMSRTVLEKLGEEPTLQTDRGILEGAAQMLSKVPHQDGQPIPAEVQQLIAVLKKNAPDLLAKYAGQ